MSEQQSLMKDLIMTLIAQYILSVERLTNRLCTSFHQPDLLSGRRCNAIPRTGRTADGVEFRFHGRGCWMSDGEVSVDFDFSPEGGLDSFDAWRLHAYSDENPNLVGCHSRDEIQACLTSLEERGLITSLQAGRYYRLKAG
jgi:hypothetical protein